MKGTYLKILPEILQNNANKVLPTKLSIKIAKLNLEVEKNLKIYKEVITKLLERYAVKENGKPKIEKDGTVVLISGVEDKWNKEYNELENEDFEFNVHFTEDELNDLILTPIQASALIELIEETPES